MESTSNLNHQSPDDDFSLYEAIVQHENISIDPNPINKFEKSIFNSLKSFCFVIKNRHSVEYSISRILRYKYEWNKDIQLQFWILALIYVFKSDIEYNQKENKQLLSIGHLKNLQNIIYQLHSNSLMRDHDILTLIKILVAISKTSIRALSEIEIENEILFIKPISLSLMIMKRIFLKELNESEVKALEDCLDYFIQSVLINEYNIHLIYYTEDLMFLLEILQKQKQNQANESCAALRERIIAILCKVLNMKYNCKVHNAIVNIMKYAMINYHIKSPIQLTHDIRISNYLISFISKLITSEEIGSQSIKNSFFLTASPKSGMQVDLKKQESFSILLSFNTLHPKSSQTKQVLLNLIKRQKNKPDGNPNLLTIYIENGILKLEVLKEVKSSNFEVKANQSHLMILTYSNSKRSFLLRLNKEEIKFDYKFEWKEDCVCNIGYNGIGKDEHHFVGELGSIVFFKNALDGKSINILEDKRYEYENLFLIRYDYSFIQPYLEFTSSPVLNRNDGSLSSIANQIMMIVSPKALLVSNSNKTSFRHAIYNCINEDKARKENRDEKVVLTHVTLLSPISPQFFLINNNTTIVEFMKLDGIQFLCLQIEYYNQIVVQVINKYQKEEQRAILTQMYFII